MQTTDSALRTQMRPERKIARPIVASVVVEGVELCAEVVELASVDAVVRLSRRLTAGQTVEVLVCHKSLSIDVRVVGMVHWTQRKGDGYENAFFLDRPLPVELSTTVIGDRRQQLRFPTSIDATAVLPDDARCDVTISNYALDGAGLVCDRPLPMDIPISLWTSGPDRVHVEAIPRWQIDRLGSYFYGCELPNEQGRVLALAGREETPARPNFLR